jgi:hypothetical protein
MFSFVFAKWGVICSFWGPKCVALRAKSAEFAAFKKVMSFVFKYFFASFPLFFIFRNVPSHPRAGAIPLSIGRWRVPAPACDKVSVK